jgi:hypothetical protein
MTLAARSPERQRRLLVAVAGTVVGVLLWVGAAGPASPGSASLTEDGGRYAASAGPGSLEVQNRSSGPNEREVHWVVSRPAVTDSTACATWRSGVGLSQNGIAFRIARHSGRYRAVVLERNVFGSAFTVFKLIYFADGRFDVDPAAVDLAPYLSTPDHAAAYPLRVCAQLRGSLLTFAVARADDAMPPLGTPGRGGMFDVRRAAWRGATGVYLAHVPQGTSAKVDSMTLDGEPEPTVGR